MKLRASARKIARLVVSRASEMKLKGQNWRVDVVASVKTCAVRCFKMTWTSHAQGNAHILIRVRVPIRVSYPLAALCRSASSMASNLCCSASRSTAGSCDPLAWSLPAFSDFGRLAFCRSSSQEDRVAMLRACSARISSQRLLLWEGRAAPKEDKR